ncbi:dehydrogenase [Paenibacillus sp. J31TS4]|uniref:Gfo/Idh/MocA family protein n=1 Tax=Paenibacillus sp. J31TS4 TaxID=2807195 RepID=UPI001B2D809B|nr:Gfo/Idh/MocA family oxidoreductase [Paenibacillus sp. J31TS4]GIP40849.1 dehydrogenase [Paenibacillus sp. J31TS4]
MADMKLGIIGCGKISDIYMQNLKKAGGVELVYCADLIPERAREKAALHGIPDGGSVEDLLGRRDIELVLNLTVPKAHAAISEAALRAGKHVYGEKPLAVTYAEGKRLMKLAEEKGLLIGSAPDTSLGGGMQTCLRLLAEGAIGTPVGASAFLMGKGPESWHPAPEFYYEQGGGPLLDMGPYYLTALVALLGPIRRVTGSARISFPERTITSQPKAGTIIEVEVPTHVAGVLEFAAGPVATLTTSFDILGGSSLPRIELYGSKGTLLVPDPNTFGGPVVLRTAAGGEWTEIPIETGVTENGRGLGVLDMAEAIRTGREPRAGGALALHVLEAMEGLLTAAASGTHYIMETACRRPEPLAAPAQ